MRVFHTRSRVPDIGLSPGGVLVRGCNKFSSFCVSLQPEEISACASGRFQRALRVPSAMVPGCSSHLLSLASLSHRIQAQTFPVAMLFPWQLPPVPASSMGLETCTEQSQARGLSAAAQTYLSSRPWKSHAMTRRAVWNFVIDEEWQRRPDWIVQLLGVLSPVIQAIQRCVRRGQCSVPPLCSVSRQRFCSDPYLGQRRQTNQTYSSHASETTQDTTELHVGGWGSGGGRPDQDSNPSRAGDLPVAISAFLCVCKCVLVWCVCVRT